MTDIFSHPLTSVDWITLGFLALGVFWGAMKGLVRELMALAAWLVAFFAAPLFSKTAGSLIPVIDMSESLRNSAGYVLVFVGVLILSNFLSDLIRQLVDKIGLGLLDKILGAGFAVLGVATVLLLGTVCVNMSPFRDNPQWTRSNVAPELEKILYQIAPALSSELRKVN